MCKVLRAFLEGFRPRAADSGPKLRSAEDYKLALHEKLLEARKDSTDFINLYVTSCYGIVGVVLLYVSGYITKVSFAGTEIDLTKGYMLEYAAGLVLLAYVLISFHLLRFARILRSIRLNGSEIMRMNPDAQIVGVDDMQLYVGGLSGLMLALARMQTLAIMRHLQAKTAARLTHILDAFVLYRQELSSGAMARLAQSAAALTFSFSRVAPFLLLRAMLAVFVVVLPLVCPVLAIAYVKYRSMPASQPAGIFAGFHYYLTTVDPIDTVLLVMLIFVTLGALLASAILVMSYSSQLIMKFLEPMNISIDEFARRLSSNDANAVQQVRSEINNWWQRLA